MTVNDHVDRFITTPDDVHDANRPDLSLKTVTELFAVLGVTAAPWPTQQATAEQWLAKSDDRQLREAWNTFKELVSDRSTVRA
ncbi:MAG: hypothetical protein WBZ04_06510 [Candidatus Nanopelagicales bacterium]